MAFGEFAYPTQQAMGPIGGDFPIGTTNFGAPAADSPFAGFQFQAPAFQAPTFQAPQFQGPVMGPMGPVGGGGGGAFPPANPQGQKGFGDWWSGLATPGKIGAILAGGSAAAGIAGALAQAFGGGKTSKSVTKTTVPPMTPEQRAIQEAAMQRTQQMDAQMQAALQQLARNQTLLAELQKAAMPVAAQAPAVAQQQADILAALAPTAQGLASQQAVLTPELARTVETAFQPAMGEISRQAIEDARRRGWAGGADLLLGPAGPIAGPALADLQGQIAKAKLEYALQLPRTAAEVAGAYTQPLQTRLEAGLPVVQRGTEQAAALRGISTERLNQLLKLLEIMDQARRAQTTATGVTTQPTDWGAIAQGLAGSLAGVGTAVGGLESSQMLARQMELQREQNALDRENQRLLNAVALRQLGT